MEHPNKLTIVIADDHPVFRRGLRDIIESEGDIKVVGEAGDGEAALEMITRLHPAIAILDVSMPKLDGLMLARKLAAQEPSVGVILVTMYREQKLFTEALDAGVKGYVLKDSAATDIISCIKAVASGQNYASPELTTYLVNRLRQADTAELVRSDLPTTKPAKKSPRTSSLVRAPSTLTATTSARNWTSTVAMPS
jgi:DNA-binding NarL/FixJ family response regulator